MKIKRLFDNSSEYIFDELIRLVSNTWKRAYRIKKSVQNDANRPPEEFLLIDEALRYQCEEVISVAANICDNLDVSLDRLGGRLASELEWADYIDENGTKLEAKPDNEGWWPPPYGYEQNPNRPKGSLIRIKCKHFIFDWRSIVADIPDKHN